MAPPPITVEEFELLPETDLHYELVDGVLLEKRIELAGHEIVIGGLIQILVTALDDERFVVFGKALHGLSVSTARKPDTAIWLRDDLKTVDLNRTLNKGPLVAIEVVSSESAADLQYKTVQYFQAGTKLVWIVYPRTRCVLVQCSDHHALEFGMDDALHAGDVIPDLKITVASIFARLVKMEAAHPTPR